MTDDWERQVKAQIRQRYAGQTGNAKIGAEKAIAQGYPAELISGLPPELVAGYSGCGYLFDGLDFNAGETVVDLGAGAGLDSWIAASQLSHGTVISVDMTIEMLKKVNDQQLIINLCADIEALPLENACADVVIANASFNLAIDKAKAFGEARRVLKTGGRLMARDLIREGELPSEVLADPLSYNTSLGGALKEADLITRIEEAGFSEVSVTDHRPFSYVQSVKITAMAG